MEHFFNFLMALPNLSCYFNADLQKNMNIFNKNIVFLLLLGFSDINSMKVLDFSVNTNNEIVEVPFKIDLSEESFTICSSSLQLQVNDNYKPIYSIFNSQDYWFSIHFYGKGSLWAVDESGYSYVLAAIDLTDFLHWIHICINFNRKYQMVSTLINGREIVKNQNKSTTFISNLENPVMRYFKIQKKIEKKINFL